MPSSFRSTWCEPRTCSILQPCFSSSLTTFLPVTELGYKLQVVLQPAADQAWCPRTPSGPPIHSLDEANPQLSQLRRVDRRRGVGQRIGGPLGLGERNDLADRVRARQQPHQQIQPDG